MAGSNRDSKRTDLEKRPSIDSGRVDDLIDGQRQGKKPMDVTLGAGGSGVVDGAGRTGIVCEAGRFFGGPHRAARQSSGSGVLQIGQQADRSGPWLSSKVQGAGSVDFSYFYFVFSRVCIRHGCCTVEFFICLVLTILGYIPGIIYALYAIACLDPDRFRGDYYQLA